MDRVASTAPNALNPVAHKSQPAQPSIIKTRASTVTSGGGVSRAPRKLSSVSSLDDPASILSQVKLKHVSQTAGSKAPPPPSVPVVHQLKKTEKIAPLLVAEGFGAPKGQKERANTTESQMTANAPAKPAAKVAAKPVAKPAPTNSVEKQEKPAESNAKAAPTQVAEGNPATQSPEKSPQPVASSAVSDTHDSGVTPVVVEKQAEPAVAEHVVVQESSVSTGDTATVSEKQSEAPAVEPTVDSSPDQPASIPPTFSDQPPIIPSEPASITPSINDQSSTNPPLINQSPTDQSSTDHNNKPAHGSEVGIDSTPASTEISDEEPNNENEADYSSGEDSGGDASYDSRRQVQVQFQKDLKTRDTRMNQMKQWRQSNAEFYADHLGPFLSHDEAVKSGHVIEDSDIDARSKYGREIKPPGYHSFIIFLYYSFINYYYNYNYYNQYYYYNYYCC